MGKMNYYSEIHNSIENNFHLYSEKPLFLYTAKGEVNSISYERFNAILKKLSSILAQLNINPGDRVAAVSSTTETYMGLVVILEYLGLVIVPIDYNLPSAEINRLIGFCEPKALFVEEKMINDISCAGPALFIMKEGCKYELVNEGAALSALSPSHPDVAAILFSSGTTGAINGVEITWKAIWLTCELASDFTDSKATDLYLNVLPLSHIAGYGTAFMFCIRGASMCFAGEINANTLLKAFHTFNPTAFEMVPEVYELMRVRTIASLKRSKPLYLYYRLATGIVRFFRKNFGISPKFLTRPIYSRLLGRNYRGGAVGAAPVSEETMRFYLDLGVEIVNGYGSTETSFPITSTHCLEPYDYKGVGKADRYKEIEVKISNPDENGIGEIFVKTELIMHGYFKNPELTKNAFEEGWYKTGDLGYIDKDNILYVKGRLKENIVLANGEKVTPVEIDDYYRLEDVKVAATGVTNEKGYDEIHLFIESDDESLIKEAMSKSLSAPKNYKLAATHLIEEIPVTSTGKIKRFELRKICNENIRT